MPCKNIAKVQILQTVLVFEPQPTLGYIVSKSNWKSGGYEAKMAGYKIYEKNNWIIMWTEFKQHNSFCS